MDRQFRDWAAKGQVGTVEVGAQQYYMVGGNLGVAKESRWMSTTQQGLLGAATSFVSTSTTGDPVHAIADLQGREPLLVVMCSSRRGLQQETTLAQPNHPQRDRLRRDIEKIRAEDSEKGKRGKKKKKSQNNQHRPDARGGKGNCIVLVKDCWKMSGQIRTK